MIQQKKIHKAYDEGFLHGWKLAHQLMERAIKETPGIGPKRYQDIMKQREKIAK